MHEQEKIEKIVERVNKMQAELQQYLDVLGDKYNMPMALVYFDADCHGAFTTHIERNPLEVGHEDSMPKINRLMLAHAAKKLATKLEDV